MGVHLDLDPHSSASVLERRALVHLRMARDFGVDLHPDALTDGAERVEDRTYG